jgi:hypothetical protein
MIPDLELEKLYAERDEAVVALNVVLGSRDVDGKEIPALRNLIARANERIKLIECGAERPPEGPPQPCPSQSMTVRDRLAL